jgi:cytochrome P450
MTLAEESPPSSSPPLAAPRPPERPLPPRQFVAAMRDNFIATYSADAYDSDFIERPFLWRTSLVVNEPQAIKHVLLDNASNYRKSETYRRMLEPALGRGLLTSEGDTWRRHRRIMTPSFDHRSIVAYSPITVEAAASILEQWDRLPPGAEFDVGESMMHVALLVISRAMFSSDSDDMVEIVGTALKRYQSNVLPGLLDLLGAPLWLMRILRWRSERNILGEFNGAIARLIAQRGTAAGSDQRDLLGRLIAARDADTGARMSSREVRDEVITIFMAGHETVALVLTWSWYLLSQHPQAEAHLHAELASVLGGRSPRYDDIAALRYTRMVLEESMRLYPPLHTVSRQAIGPDTVLGRPVPPGGIIMVSPWLLHRRPSLWKNPERFDPDRFAPDQAAGRHRFAYIPFGVGPRICVGMAFAMVESMLILAALAQRYRMRLAPGHVVEPQGLISLRPRHGMKMILERRK